jgi:UDP-N-acetylglucosamine 2-epimerase (non-hydrolysing)
MIHFFIGTKAQFIKMAPLMVELRRRSVAYRYVDSGQHAEITRSLRQVFNLPEPDVSLRDATGDIVSIPAALGWYLRHLGSCYFSRRRLRNEVFPGGGICLIHGDTLSTLLGMQMARAAGLQVAHVEAGLRSHCLWEPFPEELIRIRCMGRADLLFAPSDEAMKNLEQMKLRGELVRAPGNTVADALRLMDTRRLDVDVPAEPFALATCHRLETISKRERLRQVVELLNLAVERWPVVFVTHKPTYRYLERFGLQDALDPRIDCRGMQDYATFVALLKQAKVVLTDGGSIQEECGYLGKPCLILRSVTERSDGLGTSARLWGFNNQVAKEFLAWADSYQSASAALDVQPSKMIVDRLCELGYDK